MQLSVDIAPLMNTINVLEMGVILPLVLGPHSSTHLSIYWSPYFFHDFKPQRSACCERVPIVLSFDTFRIRILQFWFQNDVPLKQNQEFTVQVLRQQAFWAPGSTCSRSCVSSVVKVVKVTGNKKPIATQEVITKLPKTRRPEYWLSPAYNFNKIILSLMQMVRVPLLEFCYKSRHRGRFTWVSL